MGCRDCDKKTGTRYGGVRMDADIDKPAEGHFPPQGSMAQPTDPMSFFLSDQNFTYEELKQRQDLTKKAAKAQTDMILSEMTDAMRQIHLEELIETANCGLMGIPSMSSGQALVSLMETIARPDFKNAVEMFPGLREAVEKQYQKLQESMLPGRKID